MAKASAQKWTSAEVVALIRAKYSGQEYASFEQVADGTGAYAQSWIDVAAFGLWPSKGLHRLAFEVKVSRADYLKEVQNPNKNAWAKECFHEFWFVTPGGVINDVSELPEGCGWMQATRGGLRVKRQATIKQDALMDESLFASLCRSAQAELSRARISVREEALAGDRGYQQALVWQKAGQKFLASRGVRGDDWDELDEVLVKFDNATLDAQAREDRDHVVSELEHFQAKILELGDQFSVIGTVSLLECDETGNRIKHHWGGGDLNSLATQRVLARAKLKNGERRYRKDKAREFVASAERLLERAKGLLGRADRADLD